MLAGSVDDSFAVIRLNIDGSLDATFGSGGMQSYPNIPGTANAVALQTDGRIVMAAGGEGQKANGSEGQFLVARLDPNGTLDTSVDNTGFLTVVGPGLGDGFNPNGTNAVVVEPDGRIVADGSSEIQTLLSNWPASMPTEHSTQRSGMRVCRRLRSTQGVGEMQTRWL